MPAAATDEPAPGVNPRSVGAEPRALQVVIAAVVAVTVLVTGLSVPDAVGDAPAWGLAALLAGLAVGYEEGARRAAQLQIRLRTQVRADMTSVWIVTAGLALSPARCIAMLGVLYVYMWFRQSRPAGELGHRKVYNACSNILAALAAGVTARTALAWGPGEGTEFAKAAPVFAGVVVAIVLSRLLITAALLALGLRGRALAGTVHDNLIELATPCLGGLAAVAVGYEPWLVVLVIVPMIALQRGALVRDLEAAAITDSKTGLLNASAWEQLAQRELARAVREDTPVGVLIVDIDRFKGVNDRHGHLVGDQVLAGVARALKSAVRDYDGVGRFGGEEFVAVLPDADEHDALVVAERIRSRVNQLGVSDLAERVEQDASRAVEDLLSVSVGVAVRGRNGLELSELLHAADQALYRAKWNGRNQVQLARRGGEVADATERAVS